MVRVDAQAVSCVRERDYFAWLTAFEHAAAGSDFTVTRRSGKNAGKTDVSHTNVVLVGFVLARHCDGPKRADPGGNIRPGFARLRAVTGLGESALQKAINVLLRTGWLVQLRGGGKERAAVYALTRPSAAPQSVSGHSLNDDRACVDTGAPMSGHSASQCEDTALPRRDPRNPSPDRQPVQSPLVAALRGGAGQDVTHQPLPGGGEEGRRLLRLVADSLGDAGVELLTDPRAGQLAESLDEVADAVDEAMVVSVLTDGWPQAGKDGNRVAPAGVLLSAPRLGRLRELASARRRQLSRRAAKAERETIAHEAARRRDEQERDQAKAISTSFAALPQEIQAPWLAAAQEQTSVVASRSVAAQKMITATAAQMWARHAESLDPSPKAAASGR